MIKTLLAQSRSIFHTVFIALSESHMEAFWGQYGEYLKLQ